MQARRGRGRMLRQGAWKHKEVKAVWSLCVLYLIPCGHRMKRDGFVVERSGRLQLCQVFLPPRRRPSFPSVDSLLRENHIDGERLRGFPHHETPVLFKVLGNWVR